MLLTPDEEKAIRESAHKHAKTHWLEYVAIILVFILMIIASGGVL